MFLSLVMFKCPFNDIAELHKIKVRVRVRVRARVMTEDMILPLAVPDCSWARKWWENLTMKMVDWSNI